MANLAAALAIWFSCPFGQPPLTACSVGVSIAFRSPTQQPLSSERSVASPQPGTGSAPAQPLSSSPPGSRRLHTSIDAISVPAEVAWTSIASASVRGRATRLPGVASMMNGLGPGGNVGMRGHTARALPASPHQARGSRRPRARCRRLTNAQGRSQRVAPLGARRASISIHGKLHAQRQQRSASSSDERCEGSRGKRGFPLAGLAVDSAVPPRAPPPPMRELIKGCASPPPGLGSGAVRPIQDLAPIRSQLRLALLFHLSTSTTHHHLCTFERPTVPTPETTTRTAMSTPKAYGTPHPTLVKVSPGVKMKEGVCLHHSNSVC